MAGENSRFSQNNRSLLVLCDGRQNDVYLDVQPALLAALQHWGMPYNLHDLSDGMPSAEMLAGHAAVVLAQQNLGQALDEGSAQAMAEAVADGLGYVGCDGNVGYLPAPLRHMSGVEAQDVQLVLGVQAVDDRHWIGQWQVHGDRYRFKRPLEMACVMPTMPRVRVLLEGNSHPALWITQYGRGRVVQWALPPALWQREVFGHGEGLDDLLWRGIVWAARKPFAMLALPPFSTALIGDAIGSHDFVWIEALNRHGFPPNVGIFPDDLDALSEVRGQSDFSDGAVEAMQRYARLGQAEFSPHAATWNRAYLLYSRPDGTDISAQELSQRLSAVDKQFARYGIPLARTVNPHYDQLGYNVLPFLQKRGVQFTSSAQLPGEAFDGEHQLWHGAPYGHPGFTISPLPKAPHFYMVTSGRPHLETTIPTGLDTYRLRQEGYLMETDFMWGRTRWKGQCRVDDWEAVAQAAIRQIRLGLNALFFASPATNEQTIACVRSEEWEALWEEVARRTARYERWPALYSDIAAYARARHRVRLVSTHLEGALLACQLEGHSDLPLSLWVWNDLGDSDRLVYRYEQVPAFEPSLRVVLAGS